LNVVAICPDDSTTEESWTATGTKEDVVAAFKDYEWVESHHSSFTPVLTVVISPRMLKIFDLCETFNKWKILKRPPLDRWVKGKTCLLGDSCHAMGGYKIVRRTLTCC
jgi:2-polyprenyl-6-methoxyphenol hydroxylase-like FAD-dependent oxidoreductase